MGGTPRPINEQQEAFRLLLAALESLRIPYVICGSLAGGLERDFYADPQMIRENLQRGAAFNVIHLSSGFKFDIFPLTADPFEQSRFSRKKMEDSPLPGPGVMCLSMATAEDTLLAKLHWYRAGGEQPDQQWNDLLGISRVKRGQLDVQYLHRWAEHLGVSDLLKELLAESQ